MNPPPLHQLCKLAELSDAGYEAVIRADPQQLKHLAEWTGVAEVTRFEARVHVRPRSKTRFAYEADIDADLVQNCVVTLEPVRSHIARHMIRAVHIMPRLQQPADKGGVLTLAVGDDETSDEIESPSYDLAGPLLEEFALAIDPYPRAPGVRFEAPADAEEDGGASPFAALERLKRSP